MKRGILIIAIAAIVGAALWMFAQPAPASIVSIFPAGAMLYLEVRDFHALLADWDASPEKSAWLQSTNYEAFSRSWLYQKLGKAQDEFAAAAGVPPDYAMLGSVAGGQSALAIYDIGKLEFLYVTHLASARGMETALWKARGSYQTRHAGNTDYFLKEEKASHRVAAFAYVGDILLLATREDLIAGALQLFARESVPAVASEKWFQDATQAAGAGQGELRLVYNMQALAKTFQFRSHWIQRNVADLREFSSGLADLERARGEFRERRVLLRMNPVTAASANDESAVGQLVAAVPDDAGLYRAWLHPASAQAERWMEEKLFAGNSNAAGPRSKEAPSVGKTAEAGNEEDLETRIDEAPLDNHRDLFFALRQKLDAVKIDAMIEIASTRADVAQVFVKPQSALALLANSAWDTNAVREAVAATAAEVWSNTGSALAWQNGASGVAEIEGLGKIALAIDGRWLVIGDSAEMVNAIFARRNRPAASGASYAAAWRHGRELPNFERMMRLIDFPQSGSMRGEGDSAESGGEPMFFSGNLASLGRTLKRLDSAAITVHETGSLLQESLIYRLAP